MKIFRSKSGYQLIQEQANKGKTPPQYENNLTMIMPVLDKTIKGVATYKYNIPADLLIIIFERVLQISHKDNVVHFWKMVNEYYGNLIIRVPASGLELDIVTYPIEVERVVRHADGTYKKVTSYVDFPENPSDYIIYKVLQCHPDVALNKLTINKHAYYIEDEATVKKASLAEIEISKKAQALYINSKEEDYEMYLYLLRGYGIKDKELEVSNLSLMKNEDKSILLYRLVKDYPTLFIRAYEDENKKLLYYLELLVYNGLIEKYKAEYFYLGNPIGKDTEEVLKWLKSPSNQDARLRLKQQMSEFSKASIELDSFLDSKKTKPTK